MDMTLKNFLFSTSTCWNEIFQPLTIDLANDKNTGLYRLGLNILFIPDRNPFLNN